MLSPHSKWECWEVILQQCLHHRQNSVPYLIMLPFAILDHTADFLSSFSGTQHQYLPSTMLLSDHVFAKTAPHTEEHLKVQSTFPFFLLSDSSLRQYIPTALSLPFIPPNHPAPHLPSSSDLLHFPSETSIPLFYTDLLPFRKPVSTLTSRRMRLQECPCSSQSHPYLLSVSSQCRAFPPD